jgi:predicted nucleic acid-binding protein
MKKILIDTNIYSAFKVDNKDVVDVLRTVEYIGINSTVLGELYSGFKLGSREVENRSELDAFLDSPRVFFYSIDEATAEIYAEIFKTLRQKGTPIPTNDIWIAATAMQHGLAVYSLDKHFEEIPGLLRY